MLEYLKDFARSAIGLSPDTMLVFLGLGCFLITCLIARQPLTWAWALLPGILISIVLESIEIWDHYGIKGFFGEETLNIAAILLRHSKDVLIMNLGPLLVVLVANLLDELPGN